MFSPEFLSQLWSITSLECRLKTQAHYRQSCVGITYGTVWSTSGVSSDLHSPTRVSLYERAGYALIACIIDIILMGYNVLTGKTYGCKVTVKVWRNGGNQGFDVLGKIWFLCTIDGNVHSSVHKCESTYFTVPHFDKESTRATYIS